MNKFLLLLAIVLATVFLMFKFLPWWVGILCIAGAILSLRWIVPFFVGQAFMSPFKQKSKVLCGAQVTLHDVSTARPPELDVADFDNDDDTEEDIQNMQEDVQRFNWYKLDLTITPTAGSEGFTHWEPAELLLVGPNVSLDDMDDMDDEDHLCHIEDYKVFQDGRFCEPDADKHAGPQRLELHVGIKPDLQKLQFRYDFELFGDINLSESAG